MSPTKFNDSLARQALTTPSGRAIHNSPAILQLSVQKAYAQ